MNVTILPSINACLNALSAALLIYGYISIKKRQEKIHKRLMIAAFCTSLAFLCTYLTYHFMVPGVTRYQGQGIWRGIYFFILGTHTPLAIVVMPLSVAAIIQALRKNFSLHKKITRWLFPIWIYVSLTGVIIYLMLYIF